MTDENQKVEQTIGRGENIHIEVQYNSPFAASEPIKSVLTTSPAITHNNIITRTSGRGPKAYQGTMCIHSNMKRDFISFGGSKSEVQSFMNPEFPWDYKDGSMTTTIHGSMICPLADFEMELSDFDDCVIKTMERMRQTGGAGKPPKSVGLGETLGEIGLTAKGLTETLLNLSSPIPRPGGRWDIWTPDEIAEFRSWKDVFHPLEILFGLYPVAEQVTELALNAADKAQGYALKMERLVRKLKRKTSKFRATIKNSEITKSYDVEPSDYFGISLSEKKCVFTSWLTGRMTCTDITQFTIPYDIITYYNDNWAITMWDLTSYSYLFDRFTGGAVKKMLKSAIHASNSTSSGAFKKNETVIQIWDVQVHDKETTEGTFVVSCLGSNGSTSSSRTVNYHRTWPDEIGAIAENANPARGIVDMFSNDPPPLNGWTTTQYLDLLMLFVPPVVLKST